MAYTTNQLITDSYYLSGVLSEEFETISGYEINKGLRLLNSFIVFKTSDDRLIPYFSTYTFNSVIGEEIYFIPGLIELETLVFYWDTVRYPMNVLSRTQYRGTPRVETILTLPNVYYVEKMLGGANLYMYPFPNMVYSFEMDAKFGLSEVTLNQDLTLTYDQYYIEYLRYGLADYICQDYQIDFPPGNKKMLERYEATLFDTSPIDFTMKKQSILQKSSGGPDIYGQANILRGWMPP